MVDYLEEQFGKMIDQALDRSQEVGQLRAENVQLWTQLPAPAAVTEWGHEPNWSTPQYVRQQPRHEDTESNTGPSVQV